MAAAAGTKTCLICREDCSNRPRVKDPQGRYTCKACLEKARAAKPVPAKTPAAVAAPAADDAGVLSKLIDDSVKQQGPPCPTCATPMKTDQVVCVRCGFNKALGKAAKTQVLAAPKERLARSAPRLRFYVHIAPGPLFLLLVCGFSAMAIGATASESAGFAYAYLGIFWAYAIITQLMIIVWAFKDGHSGWGIIALASYVVPCLGLAVLYYIFAVTDRGHVRAMFAASIIGWLLAVFLIMNMGLTPEQLRGG